MKNLYSKCVTRLLFALFWVFAFQSTAYAQTSQTYMTWDKQVGCITYDSQGDPKDPKRLFFLEGIENAPCIRVCEFNSVTYTVNGTGISNVQWSVVGGTIASIGGANNTNASINWGQAGNGAVNVIIFYTNGTQKSTTVCVEKINSPKADFKIYGLGEAPVYCLNTPISFQNLSNNNGGSEIVTYQWDFMDNTFSNEFEPTHVFDHPGTYKVKLKVTNNCNCSSEYSMEIEITEKKYLEISCASVVCENDDKVTYTVNDDCNGDWKVTGGTIVAQVGNTIQVIWDQVDDEGFGFVSYRSECSCPFWTTIKIPVVKVKGKIVGDQTLCVNEQGLYSLPQWPSTDFVWTLVSSTSTNLVYLDQRNQVIVDALAPGIYTLQCNYTNTLLGCKGYADIRITVVAGTVITGPDAFCSGTNSTYQTTGGSSVQWELRKNNAVVASSTGVSFTYAFPTGGVYSLTATVAGGCAGQPKVINVTQTPSTPTGPIVGETKYCSNIPYEYTLNNTDPNTILEWTATPGAVFQGDNTGNNVSIIFNTAATHTITVRKRSLDGLGCLSAPLTLNLTKIVVNSTITNNAGLTTFCPSSQTSFTVNHNGVTPDLVEWYIEPSNFGNIISGINSNTVTVSWNEISTSPNGVLKVRVKKCGVDTVFSKPITLQAAPNLTLTAPSPICYGSNLNFTLTSSTTLLTGTVTWDFGNGVTTTTPVNPSSTYVIPNPYNNSTGSNINYTIVATVNLPNGCSYSVNASQQVVVFPRTKITITPGYNYTVCPTNYTPFNLNANATAGIGVTVTYKWFKNGSPITVNGTNSVYQVSGATPQGTYYVEVKDSNQCTVTSQTITVNADCAPVNPCSITPDPNVQLTASWTACNVLTAQLSYSFTGTSTVQWIGSPFLTYMNGNNLGAQFSTDIPGAHLITAKVTFQTGSGPCVVFRTFEVKKHYQPNFNTNIVCVNGVYNVTLLNNTTVFDLPNAVTYTFSGTGMSPQVGETINLTGLNPGTYTYTLTTSLGGIYPSCSVTKTIVLPAMPNVNFLLPITTYCAEEQISLVIPNYNPVNSYEWLFNNTSYVASSATTLININTAGTYLIKLKATNPYGCSYTTAVGKQVTINAANFSGNLVATPANICEGTAPAPVITFTPSVGSPTPSSLIWMKNNVQVGTGASYSPTATGSYWAKMTDVNGCIFTQIPPVNVIIRQRPYVGITGNNNLCSGDQTVLTGVVTNAALQRRWLLGGSPIAGVYGTWSTTTPLALTVTTTVSGTYVYTLEVQPVGDTTCGNSASVSVTVNPAVVAPTVSYNVEFCEPYKVKLTASGPTTGTYNWTDGQTGKTIIVNSGGAFGVTYTAPTGCSASGTVMVPHPTDRSLWVFPTGCYDFCLKTPYPYILGPLGTFTHYEWLFNANIVGQGNNTIIPNLPVNQPGSYQLALNNNGCNFESGIMHLAPNLKDCPPKDCGVKVTIKDGIHFEKDKYIIEGYIYNPNSVAVTVNLSSFNGYGTYSPSVITIPANSTYYFSPLFFYPNSNFPGGSDYMIVSMVGCATIADIKFPKNEMQQKSRNASNTDVLTEAAMTVAPNPAEEFTVVSYNLGSEYKQAESLVVFNLLGTPLITEKLDKLSGEVKLSTINLASGTYIISIQADGNRVLQQTLVKK